MDRTAERRYAAVVVAAGRGERAGASGEGPKQYREVGGEPLVVMAVNALLLHPRVEQVMVVTHPADDELWFRSLASMVDAARIRQVHGGATRQASVLAGLRALKTSAPSHVLIHDAARPFVSPDLIDRIDDALAEGNEAVLPAVPVSDTLKRAENMHIKGTVSRDGLYAAQTPQAFRYDSILTAHETAAKNGAHHFTDDCGIAEAAGLAVRIVAGDVGNVKITTAKDIIMARQRVSARLLPDVRTGNGYDVHRLVPGDGVTLCGVRIAHDRSLSGHSDADVGLHALTDALLATCGAGDIGDHFPPSDPQWRGAASRLFVEHAVSIVTAAGGTIMNADISLIAEAPKIASYRQEMRAALSDMLGIDIQRCSVKATTNEKLGFAGREEGIAAIATATVVYRETSDE